MNGLFANLRPRVKVESVLHVRRSFLGKGEINVKVGTEVTPDDILGKSQQSAGFFVVDLSKKLQVAPPEGVKYLQRSIGSKIYKGELLAMRKSFLGKKYITAPTDGVIDTFDPGRGELLLRYPPKVTPLTAGVFGIVDQVNEKIGEVVLKTQVSEIIGIFGSGLERGGVMVVAGGNTSLTTSRELNPKFKSQIVVCGALIYGEALRKAVEIGIAGIVTGGLNARDFKAMSGSLEPMLRVGADPGLGIIATEGFGAIPMGEDIFNLMKRHEGKFAFIAGNSKRLLLPSTDPDSIMRLRKVVLPLQRGPDTTVDVNLAPLRVGSVVRIIWPPFAGWQGTVVAIDSTPTKLPSGISAYNIIVQMKGRKITVPQPNLEMIIT